jgi:hypothetical protein
MTTPATCDEKDLLISYVYGECGTADRVRLEAHLAECPACAEELASLTGARHHLTAWMPPEPELGFTVVPKVEAFPARRAWWRHPAMGLAAAATLVLGIGAGLANLEVRSTAEGFVVRTGWSSPPGPPAAVPPGAVAQPASVSADDLRALEVRLRADLGQPLQTARPAAGTPRSDAGLLSRIRGLIEESERRQERELAVRLAQLVRDFDQQRRVDLMRIQQDLGQWQGLTGAEVARQRQAVEYLMRVSQR